MMNQKLDRRRFLLSGLFPLLLASGATPARAGEVRLRVSTAQVCITCRFWGGKRQVSADGKWIFATGIGTCHNPRSPHFGRETQPGQGGLVWRRWERLDR